MSEGTDLTSLERKVATEIVKRFVAEGLLPAAYAERTVNRLAEGGMKEADWRLLAENSLQLQARSVQNE